MSFQVTHAIHVVEMIASAVIDACRIDPLVLKRFQCLRRNSRSWAAIGRRRVDRRPPSQQQPTVKRLKSNSF